MMKTTLVRNQSCVSVVSQLVLSWCQPPPVSSDVSPTETDPWHCRPERRKWNIGGGLPLGIIHGFGPSSRKHEDEKEVVFLQNTRWLAGLEVPWPAAEEPPGWDVSGFSSWWVQMHDGLTGRSDLMNSWLLVFPSSSSLPAVRGFHNGVIYPDARLQEELHEEMSPCRHSCGGWQLLTSP